MSRDRLAALERGTGLVFGLDPEVTAPRAPRGATAREALESVVLEALQRPPCLVSFSGGRDSSSVLAVAAHVARREGLPLPVPTTLVFPECESAEESAWQELVVRHLALPEWNRVVLHDEIDLVGPLARPVLRTLGRTWPFNVYFHVPIFELARGGTVLSGVFGDETTSAGWAWRHENLVAQRLRPGGPRDLARIVLAAAGPRAVRGQVLRRREVRRDEVPTRPPWLTEYAFDIVQDARRDQAERESLSLRRSMTQTLWRLRSRVLGLETLDRLAAEYDVTHSAPFADERFVGALLAERSWRMFETRTAAVRHLVGDLLPEEMCARSSKAYFDSAFFHRHARAFAHDWDGTGLDPDYVVAEELRRTWTHDDEPDARTFALLQDAWLAADRRSPASDRA
ncbi:asparagine synthase-related protein [Nocardioides mangrovicus]|uniref:asparagine synthase-related protein n=1 Tax=Nocardioides mangrovicus TaxID=2478913 RepID=UPI001314832A|nr:asparagine synthase-related protein [Nocardioides mangrovicus]